MRNIAIITARGGSKRIPRKNINNFCGKPIISYSIEAALSSNVFEEVMVSTDDEEIRQIAESYGASVPFLRSEKTSNDFAATFEVLVEVLNRYKNIGKEYDNVCCIYPTAPFVTADKLKKAKEILIVNNADSVVSVVPYSFPPQRAFIVNDNTLEYMYPEYTLKRSQDLEPIYHDCGQFYFINVKRFRETERLIMENTVPFVIDELEAQDIDNLTDWKIAEIKYQVMTQKSTPVINKK